jgi:hypothetical protein
VKLLLHRFKQAAQAMLLVCRHNSFGHFSGTDPFSFFFSAAQIYFFGWQIHKMVDSQAMGSRSFTGYDLLSPSWKIH